MNNVLIKRVAMFVIMAFTFTLIFPYYNFPKDMRGIKKELEALRDEYEKNNIKKARELIEKFISKYGSDKKQNREELLNVYYIKAKIHLIFDEVDLMKNSLRELYRTNPDFTLFKDENEDFENFARAVQEQIKAELPSRVKVQVHVQSDSQRILAYNVDNPEINQAISFEKNDFELELEPGFHDFYFFSKDGIKKESSEVREGESLNFTINFGINAVIKAKGAKKKFPWVLVAGGVIVVAAMVYFLTKKAPQRTLTVSVGEGVDGSPASGTTTYKNSALINYNYNLRSGYSALLVKLDGNDVTPSGTIKMDKNHTLTATASIIYALSVMKGEGINGTPECGTFFFNAGDTVNYSYLLQSGYTNLSVKIDGIDAPSSGTIIMNGNHTITASSGKIYK